MKNSFKFKRVITILLTLFGLVAICIGTFYHSKRDIRLPIFSIIKKEKDIKDTKYVNFKMVSNIGTKGLLKVEMNIPCENDEQFNDLMSKKSRIRSDLLMRIDEMEMKKRVKQRNFAEIKDDFLKIINRHSSKPVRNIYFDSFLCQ